MIEELELNSRETRGEGAVASPDSSLLPTRQRSRLCYVVTSVQQLFIQTHSSLTRSYIFQPRRITISGRITLIFVHDRMTARALRLHPGVNGRSPAHVAKICAANVRRVRRACPSFGRYFIPVGALPALNDRMRI
jgi:hypothetical protein